MPVLGRAFITIISKLHDVMMSRIQFLRPTGGPRDRKGRSVTRAGLNNELVVKRGLSEGGGPRPVNQNNMPVA